VKFYIPSFTSLILTAVLIVMSATEHKPVLTRMAPL